MLLKYCSISLPLKFFTGCKQSLLKSSVKASIQSPRRPPSPAAQTLKHTMQEGDSPEVSALRESLNRFRSVLRVV